MQSGMTPMPTMSYAVLPFAVYLAGCIGDLTIAWHVVRAPADSACEAMRDGTRSWNTAV
jgi:hypothetical protein